MDAFLHIPVDGNNTAFASDVVLAEADAYIIDLAHIASHEISLIRKTVVNYVLSSPMLTERKLPLYVRVHGLQHREHFEDLICAVHMHADGIVLPVCSNGMDVTQLAARLNVVEVEQSKPVGQTRILAEVEHIITLDDFIGRSARLAGLIVAAPVPVDTRGESVKPSGAWQFSRMMALLAGKAAELPVIDAASIENDERLEHNCLEALHDGFSGKIALHQAHIAAIRAAAVPRNLF